MNREHNNKPLYRDFLYIFFIGLIIAGLVKNIIPPLRDSLKSITKSFTPISNVQIFAQEPYATPTPVQVAENWDEFIKSAVKIAPIYNFPVKLLISQAAHESNRGLSEFARERNNYFGMCAYDFDPNQACYYENQEQGMIAYILNIRETFPEAWNERNNPEELLRLLVRNSRGVRYATDPNYVEKVMNTPEWRNY